jgi:gas vesicle protein
LFLSHISPKCGGKNHTPIKPLEDSSMTQEESEDIFF